METNPDFDLRPIRSCPPGGSIAFAIHLVATIVAAVAWWILHS